MSANDQNPTLAALFYVLYVRPFFWWVLDFRHVSSWADRKYPPQAAPAVCGLAPCLRHLWAAWSIACGAARLCHGGFFAGRHRCDSNVRSWQCLSARNVFGFFSAQYLDQLFDRTPFDLVGVKAALIIALCSMIQAAVGGALLRRLIGYPVSFDNLRDLLLFLLLAPLMCLISATSSLSGLRALDIVPATDLMGNWITWWVGDTLGVLVALPLTLVLVGEPQPLWRSRARFVAVPMVLCFALFITMFLQLNRWESEQSLSEFRWAVLAQEHSYRSPWRSAAAGNRSCFPARKTCAAIERK